MFYGACDCLELRQSEPEKPGRELRWSARCLTPVFLEARQGCTKAEPRFPSRAVTALTDKETGCGAGDGC